MLASSNQSPAAKRANTLSERQLLPKLCLLNFLMLLPHFSFVFHVVDIVIATGAYYSVSLSAELSRATVW